VFTWVIPPRRILASILILAWAAAAKPHPVPLEKNTTDAQCLECHGERTKGKVVHPAMGSGCQSCHLLRIAKDVTRVTLTTATPVKLCIQCHADKNAADVKGQIHQPAIRDCLKCHDPHSTDNKALLLKPASGDSKESNLCLECHTTGLNLPAKGSRHAALDMGCDTCHVTHKTKADPASEFRDHLTKPTPALCLDCHQKDDALTKAHKGQPFEKADCVTCHNPHQSSSPKLMQKFVHSAFEGGACDTCHADAKDGKVVLTQPSEKELCGMCHADQVEKIAKAKVQHPGAQGDCTSCHNPHAGRTPGFLQPDPVSACLACHPDQAEQIAKAHPHQPASVAGCASCHEPHGGDNAKLLRAKSPNELCLECHGPDRSPAKLAGEHMVSIFDGKVKLPWEYFDRLPAVPVKMGMGHPTEKHPVSNVTDIGTKKVTEINCLTCHQAHGSARPDLLVKDQANNIDFCKTCHANGLNLKSISTGGK
jgi:predicted CXXCH cytochrome family protein